jgi:hypothetical protein
VFLAGAKEKDVRGVDAWLHHAPARANHAGVPTMVIDAIHAVYIEIEYLGDHGYLVRIVYRSWALGLAHQLASAVHCLR